MTAHERMIEGIRVRLTCATYSNSLVLKRRQKKLGFRYTFGSSKEFASLEEALLVLAEQMLKPDTNIEYPDLLLRLKELQAELSQRQEQLGTLKAELHDLRGALMPWAKLEERFVVAWGKAREWRESRKLLGLDECPPGGQMKGVT